MIRKTVLFVIFNFIISIIYAQSSADSIVQSNVDSILEVSLNMDSAAHDTMDVISLPMDTIMYDSLTVELDTIDTLANDSVRMDTMLINYSAEIDSLKLSINDSIEFSKYYLSKFFIDDSTIQATDTSKVLAGKLIEYLKHQQIQPVIDSLHQLISMDSILLNAKDTLQQFSDSLALTRTTHVKQSIQTLINYIESDSVKVLFYNSNNDTLSIWLKKNSVKNLRYRLFDDNNEIVGIRIIPEDKSTIKLSLEPGTLIKKIEVKKRKESVIPVKVSGDKLIQNKKSKPDIGIWKVGGVGTINFNQLHVSEHWAKGGESSLSTLSILKISADYSKQKTKWDNDAEVKLGSLGLRGDDKKVELRKSEDKFEINSKFGKKAFNDYYYTVLTNIKSQFFKGYDYAKSDSIVVSKFLSPGYIIFSLGMDYKPSKKFTLMLSPLTSKFTVVTDTTNIQNHTKFGLEQDEKVKKELGAYLKTIWKYDFSDDIKLENKLNLFTNYLENPEKIDIDWEATLKMKISAFVEATINTHLIYDFDTKFKDEETGEEFDKVQFKEYFSIGFSYKF